MYSRRRRRGSRKTGKALSSYRRRKAFGVRSRTRRVRRPAGLSRFRKSRYSSRRRSVVGRRLRGGRRAVGRARRVLRSSRDGPINTTYKYRIPSRKPSRVNKRLRKNVALATHKEYKFTSVLNDSASADVGSCAWFQLSLGGVDEIKNFAKRLRTNYWAYKEADPNTTPDAPSQDFMKYHIDSMRSSTMFVNAGTSKIHVELYEFMPRYDIHGDLATTWSPRAILTGDGHDGELYDNTEYNTLNPGSMSYNDPRFTPYLVPRLLSVYKMVNKKRFTVHGGGKWHVSMALNNFDASQYNDWASGTLTAKKSKYKVVLMKTYGELGIATTGDNAIRGIRHLDHSWVCKQDYNYSGRVGEDPRHIYQDVFLSNNQTGGYSLGKHIEEETLLVATTQEINPTTLG